MNKFYEFAVQELQNFSQTLTRTSLLLNKPWALIDEEQEIQKLIFKKDKTLILSKNGNVIIGSWDYLPEAKSLLINRGSDTILCNEGFIDEGVLVLKRDGTQNDFFVLANENVVEDLNAIEYLRKLRYTKLNISHGILEDGRTLEIRRRKPEAIYLGDEVTIDTNPADDGIYNTITKADTKYVVENKKVIKIYHVIRYITTNGVDVYIEQDDQYKVQIGNRLIINKLPAPDGKYKVKGAGNLIVEQGRIKKMPWF